MLKERFFKDDIRGNGAIFASISKDELLNLDFIIPQDDLVYRYNEITQKIDENIKSLDLLLQQLYNAIMQKQAENKNWRKNNNNYQYNENKSR